MKNKLDSFLTLVTFFCLALMIVAVACNDEPIDKNYLSYEHWRKVQPPREDEEVDCPKLNTDTNN